MKEESKVAKINVNQIVRKRAGVSYIQILILVLSSFAFSYLVYSADKTQIASAAAPTVFEHCCEKDNDGAVCQPYASSDIAAHCNSTYIKPVKCSQDANCVLGCCFDPENGLCDRNTAKASCIAEGGNWSQFADCNNNDVPNCREGCCILGSEAEFVTKRTCIKDANNETVDFRPGITNEIDCMLLVRGERRGACVFEDNECRMTASSECYALTKNLASFKYNKLCTSIGLNTTCQKTENTMCVEGKDEVYFQDSCGNPSNIYDSSRINDASYWENIVGKNESCGLSSENANANSLTCGNCAHEFGSLCKNYVKAQASKPEKGENICADLSCKQAPLLVDALGNVIKTQDMKNYASWCVYDGYIGEGKDVVGSRHFKYSCVDGEVKVEPCADFRNEICVQKNFDNISLSIASCVINNWQECVASNAKGTCAGDFCKLKTVAIDKFRKSLCTPQYPEGFDLKQGGDDESGSGDAKQICSMADATCVVIEGSKCKKKQNTACKNPAVFTKQMNDLCVSLGDCGGYVNIIGDYTDDGYTSSAGKIKNMYASMINPVEGKFAAYPNMSGLLGNLTKAAAKSSGGSSSMGGMIGIGLGAGMFGVGYLIAANAAGGLGEVTLLGETGLLSMTNAQVAPALSCPFAAGLIAGGIAMMVGGLIAKLLGASPEGQMASSFAGGIAAVISVYVFKTALMTGIIVGIIVAAIIALFFGAGKCKKKIITFKCMPWQPPVGGSKCEDCNKNPLLKPCSKYRCESLGAACELVNEGTDKELCVSKKDDGVAPKISPWYSILSPTLNYTNVSERGFSIRESGGGCVQAYTPFTFGISTDEVSKCRMDIEMKSDFESMAEPFGGDNLMMYNHSMAFSMPTPESVAAEYSGDTELSPAQINEIIKTLKENTRLYVRCQDAFGNFNPTPYVVDICVRAGPDRTPPTITSTDPENNAYLPTNTTSQEVSLTVNEPATCKWSNSDKAYSAMENNFECETEPVTVGEERCTATFRNMTKGENKFYLRCKDQPYLEGTPNASQRNENRQSYIYKLIVSQSHLVITQTSPNGTIIYGYEPVSLNLGAETSGGSENGEALCYYWNWIYGGGWLDFGTSSSSHVLEDVGPFFSGTYEIPVKCVDSANEEAYSNITFTVNIDSSAPLVVRAYNSNGLYIITNENSDCAYSTASCSFNFENGTQMEGTDSTEHYTDWNSQQMYYIKCRDSYGHEPTGCSIKIQTYNAVE